MNLKVESAFTLRRRNLKMQLFSSVRPTTVHTYPSRKQLLQRELLENTLHPRGIWKGRCFVVVWTENIFKTELFRNDVHRLIVCFPWLSFPQTQIQRPVIGAFLERNFRLQNPPMWCERGWTVSTKFQFQPKLKVPQNGLRSEGKVDWCKPGLRQRLTKTKLTES